MAIFLKNSWDIPPSRWGSSADIRYAVRVNSEKVYKCDPDNNILTVPFFWGFPLKDYSGNRNNGINYGTLYKNNCIHFDGDVDHHDYGNKTSILVAEAITVDARINPKLTGDSTQMLVDRWNTVSYGYSLRIFTDGTINVWLGDFSPYHNSGYSSGSVVTANEIQNISFTYDRTNLILYRNGINVGSQNFTRVMGLGADTIIGKRYEGGDYDFNGCMYEVRISKNSKTQEQIALFNDFPYGLYQKVSRPFYLFPIGWEGTINGISSANIAKINGIPIANIAKINGV